MLGTVESARIGFGIVRPSHNLHISRLRTKVRESLGENEFRLASEEGKAISLDEAVTEILRKFQALEEKDKVLHSSDPSNPTTRELDVLRLLVQGKSDREIADTLFIGSRTVQTHVSNLLAKLEVSNRAEAAAVAVRNGLV
jgi:NarL family two-component system response regulator LiaR